jgi:flagellar biogenesis protein FliO
LRVTERLSLGDKRQLLVVEWGERRLLVGAAGNFLATLAQVKCLSKAEGEGTEHK